MSSDAYNSPNYQAQLKYQQQVQQQHIHQHHQQHYQQNPQYINPNQNHDISHIQQQQQQQQQQNHYHQQQQSQQQHPQYSHQQLQQQQVQQQQQTSRNPATTAQHKNQLPNVYLSLLALADNFQKAQQYRLAIHCLESVLLTLKGQDLPVVTNFHIQLKTRLNLCRLYLKHTANTNQYVNAHIEKSIILVKNLNFNDEFRYEATYMIYKIFQKQKIAISQIRQKVDQSQLQTIFNIDLMQQSLEASVTAFPLWHVRLLFLISEILTFDKDYTSAAHFMTVGINYCTKNRVSTYTHIMFILCKGLVHLLQRNPSDLQTTMQPCASLIESFTTATTGQTESLKIFFLVLQVTYFLQCGQMKSVKNTLKSLQHYVQSFVCRPETENENKDPIEQFHWLHKDHMGILVYLLTVINAMQTGCFDKAQKFSEKALLNIQRLKLKEQEAAGLSFKQLVPAGKNSLSSYYSEYVTSSLHFMFLENMIRVNICMGNRCTAVRHIGDAFQLCDKDSRLMNCYAPQLHCLVGLYALSMNLKEQALSHFSQSLKNTQDTDLWLYNAMNSAVCYLESMKQNPGHKSQLMNIIDNLLPEKANTKSTSLTAFSYFFRALNFFLNSNYQHAKDSLKEAIVLANSEDLSNITANSYIFMGQIEKVMNSFQESFEMITNGLNAAEKMPDSNLKLYANSLLKDMFKIFNDSREKDTAIKCNDIEQKLTIDSFEASKMPQHALIEWNTNVSPTALLDSIQASSQAEAVEKPQQTFVSPQQQQPIQQTSSQQQPQVQQQSLHSPQPAMVQNHLKTAHNQNQLQHHQQQAQQFPNKMINHVQHQNVPINNKQQMSPQPQPKHPYIPNQHQQHLSPQQAHTMSPQQQQMPAHHSPHAHLQQMHANFQNQYHSPTGMPRQPNQPQFQSPYQQQQQQQQYHSPRGNVPMSPQQQYQLQQQLMLQQQQHQLQQHHQQQLLMDQAQMQPNNRQL